MVRSSVDIDIPLETPLHYQFINNDYRLHTPSLISLTIVEGKLHSIINLNSCDYGLHTPDIFLYKIVSCWVLLLFNAFRAASIF